MHVIACLQLLILMDVGNFYNVIKSIFDLLLMLPLDYNQYDKTPINHLQNILYSPHNECSLTTDFVFSAHQTSFTDKIQKINTLTNTARNKNLLCVHLNASTNITVLVFVLLH